MISEKQLEANRNNAQLSHGPVTDAGRKRSSMNALRHGLTGQLTTMTDEDRTGGKLNLECVAAQPFRGVAVLSCMG